MLNQTWKPSGNGRVEYVIAAPGATIPFAGFVHHGFIYINHNETHLRVPNLGLLRTALCTPPFWVQGILAGTEFRRAAQSVRHGSRTTVSARLDKAWRIWW